MITTLTGSNDFARTAALRARIDAFVAEHGDLALERVDGEDSEFIRLQEALTSLPFLADKKMVVLSRPSAQKIFTEQAEKLLSELPETTELLINEPKLDKRLSYYKYLKKHTDFLEFAELDMGRLAGWLSDQAKAAGGSLSRGDAQYLVERVGVSQQLLAGELDKLLLYDPQITRATIDLLTEATPQSTIFELLEAAFAGNTKRMLRLYEEQRALKVEPQQVIAMLAWQLHILALIKAAGGRSSDTVAAEAKLSPFVVRKSQVIASKLSFAHLKLLLSELLNIDLRLKRESLDADDLLQHYLLKLTTH